MDKLEAIKILINVARMAQKGGVLSLEDAEVVASAVKAAESIETVNVPVEGPSLPAEVVKVK